MSANFTLTWMKGGNTMKHAKTISTVLLLASLLAACGGGGGGGPAPVNYPPTIVDCLGAGSTGTLSAILYAPNGTTPIAAATTAIGNWSEFCVPGPFGVPICTPVFLPVCGGDTSTAGTIEFRNVPAGTYELIAQAGMFSVTQSGVSVSAGGTGSVSLAISATAKKLGVVAGAYDSIENVLDRLGLAWEYIPKAALSDAATLNTYDAVFLNCGMDQVGLPLPVNPDDYTDPYYALDTATATSVAANLQNFLATSGGNKRLYASDWAYVYVEKAFPSAINFVNADSIFDYSLWDQPRVGISGTITATINDAALSTALGRSGMSVKFDLVDWAAMDIAGAGTSTLISGDITVGTDTGPLTYANSPLMVSFPWGSSGGKVIFTSFHNEAQTTADMDRILERIVFH